MVEEAKAVARSVRFQFGRNWWRFLKVLDDERISEAERSLKEMLEVNNLSEKRFLDIGSGSGLFSLAAKRLGASRVHSFDYDPHSVACTAELRRRYFTDDPAWIVDQGSVLDEDYLEILGEFDIVYSWGVLHHTGAMWQALANAMIPVREGGNLLIAIYNDQGFKSRFWRSVKRNYCSGPIKKTLIITLFVPAFILGGATVDVIKKRSLTRRYSEYKKHRGMSVWHDWLDWLGGYPFEVAKPEEIVDYYESRSFRLQKIKSCGRKMGNNEFVFSKI
jgi:2-polyprenyl-6-hydroxyphenyl methylase/3-demethylubiquinone-9 3-methyltransferase